VLSEIGENEVVRDRRNRVEPCLAELALDVVLDGEAVAAVCVEAGVRLCVLETAFGADNGA
jgi:hypothetical protein